MKRQSSGHARGAPAKERRRHSLVDLIGALLLIAAGVLVALLFFMNSPRLQAWYGEYTHRLEALEDYVLGLPGRELIALAVLLLYIVKSLVPFVPISVMCFITGAVLPMTMSFVMNFTGLVILVSSRYWIGRLRGGGRTRKVLGLSPSIRLFLENDSKGKPWLLFLFRLTPYFPVNSVSQIYGSMRFDFADYVLISLLGFLPKLISYTILGHNTFQPLSIPFIVPLIIIFALSGISVLGINAATGKKSRP